MSRNGSYAKSMNGIVSFDDGDGTTIEGSVITTDTINCNTLNAYLTVNTASLFTDFITPYANAEIRMIANTIFNGDIYVGNIYSNSGTAGTIGIKNNTTIAGTLDTTQAIRSSIFESKLGTGGSSTDMNIGQDNTYTSSINIGRAEFTLLGITYPAIPPRTTFAPVTQYDICNKYYVDSVTGGVSILTLSNTFTGTTNTFNNTILTNTIKQLTTGGDISFYNKINNNTTFNLLSDATNAYGGIVNFCCGTQMSATMNIMTGAVSLSPLYISYLNLGGAFSVLNLSNSFLFKSKSLFGTASIIANTTTDDVNIFKTTTGNISIGPSFYLSPNTFTANTTANNIDIFKTTTGNISIGPSFYLSPNTFTANTITNNIDIFKTTTGAITICSSGLLNL